jgi:hypothetical protein
MTSADDRPSFRSKRPASAIIEPGRNDTAVGVAQTTGLFVPSMARLLENVAIVRGTRTLVRRLHPSTAAQRRRVTGADHGVAAEGR